MTHIFAHLYSMTTIWLPQTEEPTNVFPHSHQFTMYIAQLMVLLGVKWNGVWRIQSVYVCIPSQPFATFIARLPCFDFPKQTALPRNVRILPVHMSSGKMMMPQLVANDGFNTYVCMSVLLYIRCLIAALRLCTYGMWQYIVPRVLLIVYLSLLLVLFPFCKNGSDPLSSPLNFIPC